MKTTQRLIPLLGLAVLTLASPVAAQDTSQETMQEETMESAEQATPPEAPDEAMAQEAPCASPEHRQLDFWIGDWEVRNPDGEVEGTNRVEKILGGCVLMENWEGASGSNGKSFNTYSAAHGEWKQFWVADAGDILELAGGLDDEGRMMLSGEAPSQREPGALEKPLTRRRMAALQSTTMPTEALETATLGGGCFWCLEAVYQEVPGVHEVVSGYAGGHVDDPTYRQVCAGTTGHAEVIQVRFDPAIVPFRRIVEIFFTIHDPTQVDGQGADQGTQYRSILLYHSEEQHRTAQDVIRQLEDEGVYDGPIVTRLEPLETFYPAERYHQDYYRNHSSQPYCQVVINPKLAKYRARFGGSADEA